MTFISATVIYKLLKQFYCDAGCFPNNLTQSVYESVSRFSHVPQTVSFAIIKLFSLFNIRNCIDSIRSAPLSMNELTTEH